MNTHSLRAVVCVCECERYFFIQHFPFLYVSLSSVFTRSRDSTTTKKHTHKLNYCKNILTGLGHIKRHMHMHAWKLGHVDPNTFYYYIYLFFFFKSKLSKAFTFSYVHLQCASIYTQNVWLILRSIFFMHNIYLLGYAS